jgi:hypothetical protein
MGIILRGCFLGGMGGKSLVVSQGRKVGVFFFVSNELFLWWFRMGFLEKGGGYIFFSPVFFS